MFHSFARRLTGWYVVSAAVMVVAVLAAFAVVGLVMYVRMVQDGIDADAREAQAYSVRAALRGDHFQNAAVELENRLERPGIRMVAVGPFPRTMPDAPRPLSPRATQAPLLLRPARGAERRVTYDGTKPGSDRGEPPRPEYIIVNGKRVFGDVRDIRTQGSRVGFALATALGAHFQRVDLVDGDLRIFPDPDATLRVALSLLTGVLVLGAVAGLLGWFLGRYITSQVLRPLVDVTHALQRFATRDFTPQPIAVAGKSEFDAIAVAYNAAAAQVSAAFAERQQAESQMRQFVADAGHELRTPLTIVLGYIDLLRRKADVDERSRRIFSSIGIEGARMRTLIDNLVLLARMEGADVRPPEPFELCPLLDEMVEARRLLHPGLPIELDCRADATVIGNEAEIREAIANVVDNAIKYAPGAPIRVASDAFDGGIEVTVADRGPGIHPDDRDAIFDRFYRGATRGDVEGSGLGLAIAKRALERAGGSLVLVDTSAAGTTFALRLRADRVRKPERRTAPA
jgi:signal transduction histidine kinase